MNDSSLNGSPRGSATNEDESSQRDVGQLLGPVSTTALVAASMIGAGVYVSSGYLIADLGSPWWVLLAWLVGGVIAFCGATVYAALATRFTESGGEYLFLARAAHPVAGLMAGWVSLLAGFTGAIVLAAQAFAEYTIPMFPDGWSDASNEFAIALVVVCTAANYWQLQTADWLQRVVVLLKILLIVSLVIAAIRVYPQSWSGLNQASPTEFPGWKNFATGLMWISLSYCGFNAAIYISSEVREPQRNVPIGILGGTLLVTVVYLVLNGIFVLVPAADAIAGKKDVAVIAAETLGGSIFVFIVRITIGLSLASSVLAMTMTGPRVYAKMSQDGFLPAVLSEHGRPTRFAVLAQGFLAIIVILFASLQSLLSYLGFTLTVSSALTCCLIFLPSQRDAARRIPLFPLTPMIFVGGTAVTATLAAMMKPHEAIAAAVTILVGGIVYLMTRHRFSST